MEATLVRERVVPKKSESVRLSSEALTKARVAASYVGKQLGEYVSDLVLAHVDKDITEGHAKLYKTPKQSPKKP